MLSKGLPKKGEASKNRPHSQQEIHPFDWACTFIRVVRHHFLALTNIEDYMHNHAGVVSDIAD